MAFVDRYASFYDPFAEGNVVGPSEIFPNQLSSDHIDAPPPYTGGITPKAVLQVVSAEATFADGSEDAQSITYTASSKLSIQGQGTVIANCVSPIRLLFTLVSDDAVLTSKLALYVEVTENTVTFWLGTAPPKNSFNFLPTDRVVIKGSVVNVDQTSASKTPSYLHAHDSPARYWLSLDHKNGILRFGRDFTNLSLALYEAKLKKWVDPGVWHWEDENYKFIDYISYVSVQQNGGNLKDPAPLQLVYQPLPVMTRPTPIIVPRDLVTLDVMAAGIAMVPANLSPECQRLYDNIAGPGIALDTEDFPDFSKAIEHSVNTDGLLCQKMLKKKSGEFGKENYKTTYLRITIGADLGNSPGAPYVLEIWPAMHSSPIHDHGKAHAVIKVLHGKIKAYYFSSLHDAHQIGPPANLEKGDITWLNPENYQVHMLSNESQDGSVCCTIQCYAYDTSDTRHYENFDYIDEEKKIVKAFEPNSDMRFDEFKKAIKKEWAEERANQA